MFLETSLGYTIAEDEMRFPRRVFQAFSKVGGSVFFVVAGSSGESFAFLRM